MILTNASQMKISTFILTLVSFAIRELFDFVAVAGYRYPKSVLNTSYGCKMVDTQKCFSTNHHQCFTITKNECSDSNQNDCYIENKRECSTSYESAEEQSCQFSYQNSCSPNYSQQNPEIYREHKNIEKFYGWENYYGKEANRRSTYGSTENEFSSKNASCKLVPIYSCNSVNRRIPKTSCIYVPYQHCDSKPSAKCKPIYERQCISVPSTRCVSLPIQECNWGPENVANTGNEENSPPFHGTFMEIHPDTIRSSDPSSFHQIQYEGQFQRNMFSAICDCWELHNAFIYNVSFTDQPNIEFEVHPEIGLMYSEIQSVKTATALGRLPLSFRYCVDKFTLMIGYHNQGAGGSMNGLLLLHLGYGEEWFRNGLIEELLLHETSHACLDENHKKRIEWKDAVRSDENFISKYAKDYPDREDIAESAVAWMAARCRKERQVPNNVLPQVKDIEATIPNRLNYFDKYLNCW